MKWRDPAGKRYELSQGIAGPDGAWGIYERKPNGSLRRVRGFRPVSRRSEAESLAREYADCHGWAVEEEGGNGR